MAARGSGSQIIFDLHPLAGAAALCDEHDLRKARRAEAEAGVARKADAFLGDPGKGIELVVAILVMDDGKRIPPGGQVLEPRHAIFGPRGQSIRTLVLIAIGKALLV